MRDLYDTFIHHKSPSAESEREKKVRQARVRSFATSARYRDRQIKQATADGTPAKKRRKPQLEKTGTFRIHNYQSQKLEGVKSLQSESHQASLDGGSARKQKTQDDKTSSPPACGVVNTKVLETSLPVRRNLYRPITLPSSSESNDDGLESRAMRFFNERTAIEWTGWLDEPIWRHIAPQMSFSQPALKHALVSLALYHEHLETQEHDRRIHLWHLSFSQGRRALDLLVQDYDGIPISAIIVLYFVVTMVTSLLDRETGYQALQAHYSLLDRALFRLGYSNASEIASKQQDVTHYLLYVLRRRKEKHGRVVDILWSLAHAPIHCFTVEQALSIPDRFASLGHARHTLETLLKSTTHRAKIRGCTDYSEALEARRLLYTWLERLQVYVNTLSLPDEDEHAAAMLAVCGKIGFMLIEMMYENDEMVFDNYVGLFRELATVFEQNTINRTRSNRTNMCFYLDASFNSYVAQAAIRWCRDPQIRQRLIESLASSQRHEGVESTRAWAGVARNIKMIEEFGINPPPSVCSDIPAEKRVRCLSYEIFWKHVITHIRYVQPPWREDRVQHLWLSQRYHTYSYPPGAALGSSPPQWLLNAVPDQRWERGRVSWRMKGTDQYYVLEDLDFHFPLPRA